MLDNNYWWSFLLLVGCCEDNLHAESYFGRLILHNPARATNGDTEGRSDVPRLQCFLLWPIA